MAAGLGTALGTLAVAWLVGTSWPVRIGLVALVLLVVAGYAIWRGRSSGGAAAAAGGDLPAPDASASTPPPDPAPDRPPDGP